MNKYILLATATLVMGATAFGQNGNVGIGTTTPNANSILELSSTSKGLLLPRVALTGTANAAPMSAHVKGMYVYNTAITGDVVEGIYYNNGTKWLYAGNIKYSTMLYGSNAPAIACTPDAIYTDTLSSSSTKGKMWVCDGTSWVTYTSPAQTPFYMSGSLNDAGANKYGNITRYGGIEVANPSNFTSTILGHDGGIELYRSTSSSTGGTNGYIDFKANATHDQDCRIFYDHTNNRTLNISNYLNLHMLSYRTDSGYLGLDIMPLHPIHLANGAYVTSAGVWTNASDARLKTNIVNSTYGLPEVLKLRPVQYNMIKNGEKQVGFIAQEVRNIIPEVVSGKEGDVAKGETLGVSYGNLVPVLVNAIKELKHENDELKKRLEAIEQMLNKK